MSVAPKVCGCAGLAGWEASGDGDQGTRASFESCSTLTADVVADPEVDAGKGDAEAAAGEDGRQRVGLYEGRWEGCSSNRGGDRQGRA